MTTVEQLDVLRRKLPPEDFYRVMKDLQAWYLKEALAIRRYFLTLPKS